MKLDRAINKTGKGKYALINMRKVEGNPRTAEELAEAIRQNPDSVEFGSVGDKDEFFLIKLRDLFSKPALEAYADAAEPHDPEYAESVRGIAVRAGENSSWCKIPD